jgi:hypothetical protein
MQIVGIGTIVEIDENVVVKNKYFRGRLLRNQVWAIGCVIRGQPETFFVEILKIGADKQYLN